MEAQTLVVSGFRNLSTQNITLSERVTFLTGPNGQGKTNCLEALYYCSIFRSFRTHLDAQVVQFGAGAFRVSTTFRRGEDARLEIIVTYRTEEKKRVTVNGQDVDRYSETLGVAPMVLLSLEHYPIVAGPAQERRRYLDIVLSQANRTYLDHLMQYRKILKQRNALLNARPTEPDQRELSSWDDALVEAGVPLLEQRESYLAGVSSTVQETFVTLGGKDHTLTLRYESTVPPEPDRPAAFHEALAASRHDEFRRHRTLVGPHRDELVLELDGRDVRRYCSQGEQKSVLFALKAAETTYLTNRRGVRPVLLVDDLLSMFDDAHVTAALRAIHGWGQAVVTAADGAKIRSLASAAGISAGSGRFLAVNNGRVSAMREPAA